MQEITKNPYEDLPKTAFWRTGVADASPFSISGLWRPKFRLSKTQKIATAGSCFAQHIGKALARNGYQWFNAEASPDAFDPDLAAKFNYGVFSFRTGNIYTARALLQWVSWALGTEEAPNEAWEKDGRFYDPFRPSIEPGGFESAEEMFLSRQATLEAIRRTITESRLFVFTLGLTEGWISKAGGYTYAMCPGTLAGTFDSEAHEFHNFTFAETRRDLAAALRIMHKVNPGIRFLLTVSPVPLTATASGEHVLTATTYSKSVLRAVAGEISDTLPYADYFPSYEIITAPAFRGMFYEPNMRSVHPDGVSFVMRSFFDCLKVGTGAMAASPKKKARPAAQRATTGTSEDSEDDLVCEEVLLDAFGRS